MCDLAAKNWSSNLVLNCEQEAVQRHCGCDIPLDQSLENMTLLRMENMTLSRMENMTPIQ